jgi:hypothetical protein
MTYHPRPAQAWLYFALAIVGGYGDAVSVVLAKTSNDDSWLRKDKRLGRSQSPGRQPGVLVHGGLRTLSYEPCNS